MTVLTAMMMTITLTLIVTMVPRIYHAFLEVEALSLEEEWDLLRELLVERNSWVLRHVGCGLGSLLLIWMAKTFPDMELSNSLAKALAVYASSSLGLAVLESLLAQKISGCLAAVPAPVKVRDQE